MNAALPASASSPPFIDDVREVYALPPAERAAAASLRMKGSEGRRRHLEEELRSDFWCYVAIEALAQVMASSGKRAERTDAQRTLAQVRRRLDHLLETAPASFFTAPPLHPLFPSADRTLSGTQSGQPGR